MAITVTSDQTLVNATGGAADETTISANWVSSTTTAWATAPVYDGDMYIQGSGVIGARASGSGASTVNMCHLTTGTANLDLTTSGYHVYFWIKCITLPAMDAKVRGGIGLSISSTGSPNAATVVGTNPWSGINDSKQWFLTGNDFEGTSGWICYVVDPASTSDWSTGTPVMTSVDYIGIRSNVINGVGAGAFKPKNILWDALRYGTKLTITGSTGTLEDIYAADSTTANQYGILRKSSGIYLGGGKLVFGTIGQLAPCVVTDSKQTIVWQDMMVASGFYQIQLVGNTTPNVTTVTLGTYSGGLTSGGCTIRGVGLDTRRLIAPAIVSGGTGYTANDILTVSGGTSTVAAQFKVTTVSTGVITGIVMQTAGSYSVPPTGTLSVTGGTGSGATFTATVAGGSIWTLTASAANQTLNIYGSTLSEMLSAALASTTTWRGNTIVNSGTITASGALIDKCTFQDLRTATPISASYCIDATTSSTITNCTFVNAATALKWTCGNALNGKIDGTSFTSGGTGHAIELVGTATNQTLTNVNFSGYAAVDGSTGNEAIYVNIATGSMTITVSGGNTPFIRTAGAIVTVISGAVNVTITVKDNGGVNIQNARVLMLAAAGGPMPYAADTGSMALSIDSATAKITRASGSFITDGFAANSPVTMSGFVNGGNNTSKIISTVSALEVVFTSGAGLVTETGSGGQRMQNAVTITRSVTTATVTHNAHGMATNDYVQIKGADQIDYNGVFQITKIDANSYSYTVANSPATPATGTIKATFSCYGESASLGLTDTNGQITMSRVFSSNQPVSGRVRKSTAAPYYKTSSIVGTINSSTGLTSTILLLSDE